jgi:hypothetical protein
VIAFLLAAALALAAPGDAADPGKPGRPARSGKASRPGKAKAGKAAAGKAEGRAGGGRSRGLAAELQPAPGQPIAIRPAAARPLDNVALVRSVARGKAYVDGGTREGLAVGAVLQLQRRGSPAGQCTVEVVTERNAVCAGTGVRVGDTVTVNPSAAGSLPAVLPPRPAPEEQARRLASVEQATLPLVDFKSTRVVEVQDRLRRVAVGLASFGYFTSDAGGLFQEQVYASAHGVEVFRGGRLDLDLTAVARTPVSDTERFEPGRVSVIWVREASLTWAEPGSPWRIAAGRVLPWLMPGGNTFDGAQAGWRPREGTELGVFGGGVPDLMTTAPGFDRATGGGYWAVDGQVGGSVLRNEGRLALVRLPGSRSRVELETAGQAWVGRRLSVDGMVRAGFGDYAAPGKIDSGRVDASYASPNVWSASAGYHYENSLVPQAAAPALYPGRSREVAGSFSFDRMGWLLVRANASHFLDLGMVPFSPHQTRTWGGPEVVAPRLFGARGGMSIGYSEQLGTWAGRSAWVQGDLTLGRVSRLMARAAWMMDARPSPLAADQTVGLTVASVNDLAPWLRLRLSGMGRYGIPPSGEAQSDWGATFLAALEVRY